MSRSTLKTSAINAEIRKAQAAAAAPAAPAGKKATAKDKPAAAAPKGAGEIRIIGGAWKRTRLPVAQRPGLRPTPDRVRETLFNWLGQDLSGWRCLDAFAGTGALGFEAASRGAASVQLVESDAALVAQLHTLQQRLQATAMRVQRGDGVAALKQAAPASLDLVLLDPPFDSDFLADRFHRSLGHDNCAQGVGIADGFGAEYALVEYGRINQRDVLLHQIACGIQAADV